MAKAVDLVGTLAKEKEGLSSRVSGTTAKVKGIVVKGLLARDLVAGLVIGSVLAVLYGAFLVLTNWLDPAAAAGLVGLAVITTLFVGAHLATRPPKG